MSRLLPDRLLASLAPGSVALARMTRGLRPRIVAKQTIDCDPASGAEPWRRPADALAQALELARGERLDVTVVLSNHFVRYAVVPFDPAITGPEESLALARFHFSKIHGERARSWDVRVSAERHGAAHLASAVDAALVDAIRAGFPPGSKARLVSVQPYLMAAFNQWRGAIAKEDAWLLLVEPQRACLALLANGAWTAAQTARGKFATSDDWVSLLEQQQLRTEAAPVSHTVLVHAPELRKSIAFDAHGWQFLGLAPPRVNGFLPLEDTPLAMALTAQ